MSLISRISARFRRRRMERFASLMGVNAQTRILDVGGSPDTWRFLPFAPKVTLLNIPMSIHGRDDAFVWVAGDGCALPFADRAFDIVFSNSVIEHVGGFSHQCAFARETVRVGKRFFVQTPNAGFPIEQHLFMPFLHWLPKRWQKAIVQRFTIWDLIARPRRDQRDFYLRHYLEEVRLLRQPELAALFASGEIRLERAMGLPKSLLVFRR